MADLTRAEDLVQTMERDDAFQAAIQAAPTITARREILDAHGFQDVGLEDMRAYVESKGGKLVVPEGGRELSEQELAAVAGGMDIQQGMAIGLFTVAGTGFVVTAGFAFAAAAG